MDINTIASSSAGNCYTISDGTTKIMIECGVNISKIKEALNYDLTNIVGCLVSHSHQDHCKAWKDILKAAIDLYMTQETAEALKIEPNHRLNIIEPKKQFEIGSFIIKPFNTEHDCPGSVGFFIVSRTTKERLVFITDSYYSRYKFNGITHLMIEANYEHDIIEQNIEEGTISPTLARRLAESHFSIDDVLDFLRSNDLSDLHEVHLIHISSTNGDKERFKRLVEELTGVPTYVK